MHLEEALKCIQFGPGPHNQPFEEGSDQAHPPNQPMVVEGICSERLLSSDFFDVERVCFRQAGRLEIVTNEMPIIWMILDGVGRVAVPGAPTTPLRRGDTALLPAGLNDGIAMFDGPATLLHVTLPSPLKGLIA